MFQVTRVSQVIPVDQVRLDFLVFLGRLKDSRDNLGFPGCRELQASLDLKEKRVLWDFLACLEQG